MCRQRSRGKDLHKRRKQLRWKTFHGGGLVVGWSLRSCRLSRGFGGGSCLFGRDLKGGSGWFHWRGFRVGSIGCRLRLSRPFVPWCPNWFTSFINYNYNVKRKHTYPISRYKRHKGGDLAEPAENSSITQVDRPIENIFPSHHPCLHLLSVRAVHLMPLAVFFGGG